MLVCTQPGTKIDYPKVATTIFRTTTTNICKDFKSMSKLVRITAWALVAGFFLVGCSYQRKVYLKSTDLPEHIYRIPLKNDYLGARVAVFNFREPHYARGMGAVAAASMYHELLANKVFVSVTHEEDVSDLRMENLMDFAQDNHYDLIIIWRPTILL